MSDASTPAPQDVAASAPRTADDGFVTWQRRNTFAQWVSALAACVALFGVFLQLKSNSNTARESSARQLYGNYMEAGLRYPEFLAPDFRRIKADPKQFAQYRWFVLYFLFAYDEVFQAVGEEGWVLAFRAELRPHLPLLCDMGSELILSQYYPRTAHLLRTEMLAARKSVPECANVRF